MSARHLLLPSAAVLFALTACGSTAAPVAAPAAASPTASPTTSPEVSPTAAPASPTAEESTEPAAPPVRKTRPTKAPGGAGCPSAADLEKLVELPKGQTFGKVDCVQGWAGADPQGPNIGDGVYLFHYKAGAGWKYYGEGSGYDCADLGIKGPASFCIS